MNCVTGVFTFEKTISFVQEVVSAAYVIPRFPGAVYENAMCPFPLVSSTASGISAAVIVELLTCTGVLVPFSPYTFPLDSYAIN